MNHFLWKVLYCKKAIAVVNCFSIFKPEKENQRKTEREIKSEQKLPHELESTNQRKKESEKASRVFKLKNRYECREIRG